MPVLTPAEVVKRARSALARTTKYKLGAGGFDPDTPHPSQNGGLDCSGFVSWALGIPREQPHTIGWVETTRVAADATGKHRLFQKVTLAEPGDVIVYGDTGGHEGHIGIITEAVAGKPKRVAHCTARSGLHSAIIDEPYSVFWAGAVKSRGAIFARPLFLAEEGETMHADKKVLIDSKSTGFRAILDPEQGTHLIPLGAVKERDLRGATYEVSDTAVNIRLKK